jgi:hypothetical protein
MTLVRTSQAIYYVSVTKYSRLTLFGEIVAVYCENHTEHTDRVHVQNGELYHVKACGTCSNHWASRDLIISFHDVNSILKKLLEFNFLINNAMRNISVSVS